MRILSWLRDKLREKLAHLSTRELSKVFKEHGAALVVIIVGWEIVEDVVFPAGFAWLGATVHPSFYAGVPISIIGCVHWLAVPILWHCWIKLAGTKEES